MQPNFDDFLEFKDNIEKIFGILCDSNRTCLDAFRIFSVAIEMLCQISDDPEKSKKIFYEIMKIHEELVKQQNNEE
jgi:hypothetical protein